MDQFGKKILLNNTHNFDNSQIIYLKVLEKMIQFLILEKDKVERCLQKIIIDFLIYLPKQHPQLIQITGFHAINILMKIAVLSLLSVLVSSEIVDVQNNDLNMADYDIPGRFNDFSQTQPIFSDFSIRIGDDGFWKLNEESMSPKQIFKAWRKKYFRNYFSEEQQIRINYFKNNVETITKHNSDHKSSYEMAANKFADLSDEEFQSYYLMNQPKKQHMPVQTPNLKHQQQDNISSFGQNEQKESDENKRRLLQTKTGQIDWRRKIRFAPIKSQHKCSACYAFAVTAVVQLHIALRLRTRTQPILSEQLVIDCCHGLGYDCYGCTYGNMGPTLQFYADKGIATIQNYPYTSIQSQCKLNKTKTLNLLDKASPFTRFSGEDKILDYLLKKGPLAIQLDSTTWKLYQSGIFDGCNMNNFNMNHDITLIGVTQTYWIIRNSWGTDWGEKGYMRLKRGGNVCGMLYTAFYPNLK